MHRLLNSLRNATTARVLLRSQSRPASNFTPLSQQTLATVSHGRRLETLHLSSCFKPAKRWEKVGKKRLALFQNFFFLSRKYCLSLRFPDLFSTRRLEKNKFWWTNNDVSDKDPRVAILHQYNRNPQLITFVFRSHKITYQEQDKKVGLRIRSSKQHTTYTMLY